jgi:hypothetical protein
MNEDSGEAKQPISEEEDKLDDLPSLSTSGPLTSSARVAILAALLAFKRTTFTELMLAVNLPKSSLNLGSRGLEGIQIRHCAEGIRSDWWSKNDTRNNS